MQLSNIVNEKIILLILFCSLTLCIYFIFLLFFYKKKTDKKIILLKKEIKKQTDKINELEKTEAENKSKSQFLANISHEIRTPLSAIIGFSELLYRKNFNSKEKNYIEAINNSGHSLLTLVNDLLDLSKIESGMFKIDFEPINIYSVIREIETIFRPKSFENKINFNIVIAPNLPEILILNEVRLKQILFNIIGNSFKFTEKGFIKLRFFFKEIQKENFSLIIEIEDSGIGIAKSEINEIFKPFKQQKHQKSSKYGGTGLGLAITKEITTALNGKISVESIINKGSTFRIEFKNISIGENIFTKENYKKSNIPKNIKFKKASVIIADDNKLNRQVLSDMLSDINFDVVEAKNGKELLISTDTVNPVFIICDIKMPILDGIDATRILKLDEKTKNIPILALTAYSETALISESEKAYFDDFLTKPIGRNKLISVLSKFAEYEKIDEN